MNPENNWEKDIYGVVQSEQELIASGQQLLEKPLRTKDIRKVRAWQRALIDSAEQTLQSRPDTVQDEARVARINELERISDELHQKELKTLETWWRFNKNESDYDVGRKLQVLRPFFGELDKMELVGNRVLDVGAGLVPLSSLLKKPGRQLIALDHVAPKEANDHTFIKGDVREMTLKPELLEEQLRKTLGENTHVDTIIFSDILNYTPYEETVKVFGKFLKPGGLLITLNKPGRTFVSGQDLLHPESPTSVKETVNTIRDLGYRQLFHLMTSPRETSQHDHYMSFDVYRHENWLGQKMYGQWEFGEMLPIGPER